jgi:ribosomal protein L19E
VARLQEQRLEHYRERLDDQERRLREQAAALQQQRRMAQYRHQQEYLEHLREQRRRLRAERHDHDVDRAFYAPPAYRYRRGDAYYEIDEYGAEALKQAVNYGYQEGFAAGSADREDGWAPSYRDSYAYEDAIYGYDGYSVDPRDYRYYFREGFRRGYEDGYRDSHQYGYRSNGSFGVLGEVLAQVLGLQPIR